MRNRVHDGQSVDGTTLMPAGFGRSPDRPIAVKHVKTGTGRVIRHEPAA